ncbi:hypothetical protein ES705_14585 [subsurface metagenome]
MSNKNPRTRIVNIPAQFYPLLKKEVAETGCFSFNELMGRILRDHYGHDPANKNNKPAATVKEKRQPVSAIKGLKE